MEEPPDVKGLNRDDGITAKGEPREPEAIGSRRGHAPAANAPTDRTKHTEAPDRSPTDPMQSPPDNLDTHALGRAAPEKGLAREACPYAEGTEARELWLSGYDEAVAAGAEPVTGGIKREPGR